jgi:hypothetical protein
MYALPVSSVESGEHALLSLKGRAILSILLSDYERHGLRGLTRRQIAYHLRQRRLYPHDDRAIRTLAGLGLIDVTTETRRAWNARALDDDRVQWERKHIAMNVPYHVHTLNELAYDDVRALLGYAPPRASGGVLRGILDRFAGQRRARL